MNPDPNMVANLVARHEPAELAAMYLRSEHALADMVDKRTALLLLTEKQAGEYVALKGQITKQNNSAQIAEDIGVLLDLWLALCATPRQRKIAAINVDGPRGKYARAALKTMTKGKREDCRERCADAIRGKSLRPYLAFGQWYAGPGKHRVWANDVEHALGSEKRIEEHAAFWEHVQSQPLEWRQRQWQTASFVEQHYQSLYFDLWLSADRVADREALVEPGLSVLPGTSVEIPQPQEREKRPKLFVVPDPESEAA